MKLATFGEILLRLSPPGHSRIAQSTSFEAIFAGAEANVAVAAAALGHQVEFLSILPANEVGDTALHHLNFWGVQTSRVLRGGRRLGIYFFENGFGQRTSEVIYDREGSAIAEADPASYCWPELLGGIDWFHTSGITAALSPKCAQATAEALATARKLGIHTSLDLNYRAKLWTKEKARKTMEPMLGGLDLFIANAGQLKDLFGIEGETPEEVADKTRRQFGIKAVAFAVRHTDRYERHFRAAAWADEQTVFTTERFRCAILEPLGGGDAFAGALIASLWEKHEPRHAVEFAVAAACLKHTIPGDFAKSTRQEIDTFLANGVQHGVAR